MVNKNEVMQMALTAIEHALLWEGDEIPVAGFISDLGNAAAALRAALAQPEPDARKLAKMRQTAWKSVRNEYKDDPECCFALGFDAGYDAVARRVEPPITESGAGFKSLPASPITQIDPTIQHEWVGLTRDQVSGI